MATGAWSHGAITTQTTQTEVLKPSWRSQLNDTYLTRNSLVSMLTSMGAYGRVDRDTHNWATYKEKMEYVTVTTNSDQTTYSIITVSTTDIEKIAKYHVLRNPRNDQVYYVYSTVHADAITAYTFRVRKLSATANATMASASATDIIAGDVLYIVGQSYSEKWADITNASNYSVHKTEDTEYNYIEMMFAISEISKLQANSGRWIDSPERITNTKRMTQRMWQAFEAKCFTGMRAKNKEVSTSEVYTTFMGGIGDFTGLQTKTDYKTSFTWDDFKSWIESDVMSWNDSPNLKAYCNNAMYFQVNKWIEENSGTSKTWSASGEDSSWGYQVRELITPGPRLELINNLALRELNGTDAVMYIVDLNLLNLKYYGGVEDDFGFKIITNCELKGNDNLVDKIEFWPTLEVLNAERMGKLRLLKA
jgi:hypothetical protein